MVEVQCKLAPEAYMSVLKCVGCTRQSAEQLSRGALDLCLQEGKITSCNILMETKVKNTLYSILSRVYGISTIHGQLTFTLRAFLCL